MPVVMVRVTLIGQRFHFSAILNENQQFHISIEA